MNKIAWLERLVGFDTASSKSNLEPVECIVGEPTEMQPGLCSYAL